MKNLFIAALFCSSFGAFAQEVKTAPAATQSPSTLPAKTESQQIGTEKGNYERSKVNSKALSERLKEAESKREMQTETVTPK